jgi:hypothetical protein
MKHRLRPQTAALAAVFAISLTGPAALAGNQASPETDPTCAADGRLFVGDRLTCASPHQPDPKPNEPYHPQGRNFPIAGKYGTPAVPSDPRGENCHPVTGHGSLDLGSPAQIHNEKNGRKIGRVVVGAHGYSGYGGPDGFFSVPLDVYINPDGSGGFVARELFEGTIDGRTGAMVSWVEGTFDHLRAGGKFTGYSYTIRGMEGLTGIQHKAYFVGVFGKGYEWVDGVYCWNGFNGVYDHTGKVAE